MEGALIGEDYLHVSSFPPVYILMMKYHLVYVFYKIFRAKGMDGRQGQVPSDVRHM